jgi:hypothetical protein
MKALGHKSLAAVLAIIINVIWWLEWAAAALVTIVVLITSFSKREVSLDLPVTFSRTSFKNIINTSAAASSGLLQVSNGDFRCPIPIDWQNTLLLLAGFALLFSIIILLTRQLKVIFFNLRHGQPFNESNTASIRNIGILLVALSVLQWIFIIVLNSFLSSHFKWNTGIQLTYQFNLSYLLTGILLIIAAQIFRLGVTLEEEKQLTI